MVGNKLKNTALFTTLAAATTVAGFFGIKSASQSNKNPTSQEVVTKEPKFDLALPDILEEMFAEDIEAQDRKKLANLRSIPFEQARKMRDDVCREYMKVAKDFEKDIDYIYLCSKGCLTVGVGCNVNDWKRFSHLEFRKEDGTLMSMDEKKELYDRFCKARDSMDSYNYKHQWYKKNWCDKEYNGFRFPQPTQKSIDRLSKFCVEDAFYNLCNNFSNAGMDLGYFVSDKMMKTGNYKGSFIMGAMDLQYNTGHFKQNKWPKEFAAFLGAVQAFKEKDMSGFAKYMATAIKESARKGKGIVKKRNAFTRRCFANCTSLYNTQPQENVQQTFRVAQCTTR